MPGGYVLFAVSCEISEYTHENISDDLGPAILLGVSGDTPKVQPFFETGPVRLCGRVLRRSLQQQHPGGIRFRVGSGKERALYGNTPGRVHYHGKYGSFQASTEASTEGTEASIEASVEGVEAAVEGMEAFVEAVEASVEAIRGSYKSFRGSFPGMEAVEGIGASTKSSMHSPTPFF